MSEFNKISKRAVAKEKYRKNMKRKSEKKRRKKEGDTAVGHHSYKILQEGRTEGRKLWVRGEQGK